MTRFHTRFLAASICLWGSSCDSSEPTDVTANNNNNNSTVDLTDGNGGLTPPAPYDEVAWDCEDVQVDNPTIPAGQQARLLRNDVGDLFYAYLRPAGTEPVCNAANFSDTVNSPTPVFDFLVAVKEAGATNWSIEEIDLEPSGQPGVITDRFGIGAALSLSGQPAYTVAAGEGGLFTCGSSDLVRVNRVGTDSYSLPETLATNGADFAETCPTPGPGEDPFIAGEVECCVDPACGEGDDVGAWSDIAISAVGQTAVVYSDFHNATTQDGGTFQGVELWEPGGISGVRPYAGLGRYASLIYTNSGALVLAFTGYNGGGLYVLSRQASGSEWVGANGIKSGNLFASYIVGQRISLAVANNGTVGVAFHAIENPNGSEAEDLWYCESDDQGLTFSNPCTLVERNGILKVGAFPSLAYDSMNRPAISYYYCGPDDACSRDGLRYAWRDDNGKWWYFNVHNVDNNASGEFSSLVFDGNDTPIIAFHDRSRGAAMVATGAFGATESGSCGQ